MKDLHYSDVLLAWEAGRSAINEASLGRTYQHLQKAKTTSYGILTSYRYADSLEKTKENHKNFERLKQQIRSAGIGFFRLMGHWLECQDKNVSYDDCPEEQLVDVVEPSLFVSGISFELFQNLVKEYDQDAGIYAGPETNGQPTLFKRDGSSLNLGSFSPQKISQAYSSVKGQNFVFETPVNGFWEGMLKEIWEREHTKQGKSIRFPKK